MLSPDVTIKDVWHILRDRKAYAESVLNSMDYCVRKHGNARVRIGTDGHGKYPSYRIVYDELREDGSVAERVFSSFFDSGKPFPKDYALVVPGDWSITSNTLAEVEELLAQEIEQRRNKSNGKFHPNGPRR